MICPKCSYEWEPRKPNPKVCPRCKARLDYGPWKLKKESGDSEIPQWKIEHRSMTSSSPNNVKDGEK